MFVTWPESHNRRCCTGWGWQCVWKSWNWRGSFQDTCSRTAVAQRNVGLAVVGGVLCEWEEGRTGVAAGTGLELPAQLVKKYVTSVQPLSGARSATVA